MQFVMSHELAKDTLATCCNYHFQTLIQKENEKKNVNFILQMTCSSARWRVYFFLKWPIIYVGPFKRTNQIKAGNNGSACHWSRQFFKIVVILSKPTSKILSRNLIIQNAPKKESRFLKSLKKNQMEIPKPYTYPSLDHAQRISNICSQ